VTFKIFPEFPIKTMTVSWQDGRGKMVGNLIRSGQKINDDLNNLGEELKKEVHSHLICNLGF